MEPQSEDNLKSELESFRREWLSEVRANKPAATTDASPAGPSQLTGSIQSPTANTATPLKPPAKVAGKKPVQRHLDDDDHQEYFRPPAYEDDAPPSTAPDAVHHLNNVGKGKGKTKEPVSALEHYETAVEKESQGSLGDSLRFYRKAFRMDNHVDKKYKEKYFPKAATASKPHKPNPSNASPTVPSTAHHSSAAGGGEVQTITSNLIASFAGMAITGAPPPVEGMPAPPCIIATVPGEVLSHIFRDVATADMQDLARLAQVCKRFAYVVATDSTIWRRLCEGPEFGFPGMHREYARTLAWDPVSHQKEGEKEGEEIADENSITFDHARHQLVNKALQKEQREARREAATQLLLEKSYAESWKNMLRSRPRIRFGGAYISTVNYWRSGQAGPNQVTWGSPMHVVTYYRYLRFFRDGTLISLLTTHAPAEVVPHFTRENCMIHAGGGGAHLASSVIAGTYKGVWKLGCSWMEEDSSEDSSEAEDEASKVDPAAEAEEAESHVSIKTEGVGRYTFDMELVMRSAGRAKGGGSGTRNNKLTWSSFSSYHTLTDDRAEFALKNDKPFFFSRVGSYGVGE